jgi:hypothetical protein
MGSTISATLTPLESFGKTLPVIGTTMQTFIDKTKAYVKTAFGASDTGAVTGDVEADTPTTVTTPKKVLDGII